MNQLRKKKEHGGHDAAAGAFEHLLRGLGAHLPMKLEGLKLTIEMSADQESPNPEKDRDDFIKMFNWFAGIYNERRDEGLQITASAADDGRGIISANGTHTLKVLADLGVNFPGSSKFKSRSKE